MVVKKRKRHKGKIDNDRTEVNIPQNNIVVDKKAKIEVLEEYYNYDSQRLTPITAGTLERLVINGIKWAREIDDAIKLSQFMDLNGIPLRTWQRWEEKYPAFYDGTRNIISVLGNKRELGLLRRKFDSGSTMFTMPLYDKEWKDLFEWRSKLTQKEVIQAGQQFIVMEKTANSPMVPERKEEE